MIRGRLTSLRQVLSKPGLQVKDSARAIFQAATLVGVLALVVKLMATGKEMLVAYRLGVDVALDAFLIAYLFPSFLVNVIGGSLTSAFVPLYVGVRNSSGAAAAAGLVRALSLRVAIVLVLAALVGAPAFASLVPLVARGFDADTVALSQRMVYELMPLLVLNGLTAFWVGALNARERFALGAAVPALSPLLVMAMLIAFWDRFGVGAIVAGTVAGAAAEMLIIGKCVLRPEGRRSARLEHMPIRSLLHQFLPAMAGNLILGTTTLVDQTMAASLSAGSVAALSYGSKLTIVIVGVGGMALATVFLPHFSRMVAERDIEGLKSVVRQYSVLILIATSIITAILVFGSEPITRLLYARGAFSDDAVALVSKVQWMYALQIPFFTWSMMAVRLISALRQNHVLLIGAAISLVLNAVLNLWFSHYLGVAGIALSTSVVYTVSCAFLWIFARRGIAQLERTFHESAVPTEGR